MDDLSRRGFLGILGAAVAAPVLSPLEKALAFANPPKKNKSDERVTDYNVSISYLNTTGGIYDPSLAEGVTEIPPLEPVVTGLTPVNYTGLMVHLGPTEKGARGRYLSFNNNPRATLEGIFNENTDKLPPREEGETDDVYRARIQSSVNELIRAIRQELDPRLLEGYRNHPELGANITVKVVNPNFSSSTFDADIYELPSATYEFVIPTGTLKEASLSLKSIGPVAPGAEVGIYLEKVGVADSRRELAHLVVSNPGSADPQTLNLPNLVAGTYHVTIQHLPSSRYPSNLLLEEVGITGKLHETTGKKRSH